MIRKLVVAGLVSLAIVGCNSGSSGSGTGKINLAFSDAPVDGLDKVCVAFDEITVHHVNGSESNWGTSSFAADQSSESCIPEGYKIPENGNGPEFMVINLMDYQGEESLQVLSDEVLEAGKYTQMRLSVVVDGHYENSDDPDDPDEWLYPSSYVTVEGGNGDLLPIRVPSGKLKLDGFEVEADATQAYTLEFDLRKSMVLNSNGYQLKPRGVRLVKNEDVATISGDVATDACGVGEGLDHAYVYVYTAPTGGNYGDLGSDSEPYTSVAVDMDNGSATFEIGYVPLGDYDIVLVCDGSSDDPDFPGDLTIDPDSDTDPDPAIKGVTLTKDGLTDLSF